MTPRRGTVAPVAAFVALASAACADTPREAVIGLHGIPTDRTFLESIADTLLAGEHPIRLEVFNPTATPGNAYADALLTAQALASEAGLVGVVGHRDSRSTLVVGPIYRDAGIPLVVPNATAQAIDDLGPDVFRMVPDDVAQGQALARAAARGLGARAVTVFHVADEFGTGIRNGVVAALESEGVEVLDVTAYGLTRSRCPEDFRTFVDASLLRGTPDALVIAGRNADSACIGSLFLERAPDLRFLVADGVDVDPQFRLDAAPMLDLTWFATFIAVDEHPALRAFEQAYSDATGAGVDKATGLRIDGVRLLVQAVREVGPDRGAVADWLRGLGTERPAFTGVTGPISFAPGRRRPIQIVDSEGHVVPREGW